MHGLKWLRMWFVLCLAMMAGSNVFALGLGDIEVRSGLNQRFDAEIQVLAVKSEEVNRIKVTLASDAAYTAAGVEKLPILNQLKFNIERGSDGQTVIKVTSAQPIKEPFLDFILEANWPAGRLLREYTVLLDPPLFEESDAPATQSPSAGSDRRSGRDSAADAVDAVDSSSSPRTQSITDLLEGGSDNSASRGRGDTGEPRSISDILEGSSGGSVPAPNTNESAANGDPDKYGPIRKGETLSEIATELRGGDRFSMDQVMLALYDRNPQAFFDNNINNLKAGFVLRRPDEATIARLSRTEAAQTAREHYSRWLTQKRQKEATSSEVVNTDAGLADRSDDSGDLSGGTVRNEGGLKLAPPEAEGENALGGDPEGKGDIASAIRQQQEQSERDRESQIDALEQRRIGEERALTLQDETAAALQSKSGRPSDSTEADSDSSDAGDTASNQTDEVVDEQEEIHTDRGWEDLLTNPTVLAGLVSLGVVIGAIIWMMLRRRQEAQEEMDMDLNMGGYPPPSGNFRFPADDNFPQGGGGAGRGGGGGHSGSPNFVQPQGPVMRQADSAPVAQRAPNIAVATAPQVAVAADPLFDSVVSSANSNSMANDNLEEIDAIAEADVYLAYRRFQQAEELMRDALQKEPERQDLHLKMLEIHYGAGNQQGFEAQAEALYALLGGEHNDAWKQTVAMGRELCPNHPLFADNALGNADVSPIHEANRDSSSVGRGSPTTAPTAGDELSSLFEGGEFDGTNFAQFGDSAPVESNSDAPSTNSTLDFESGLGGSGKIRRGGSDSETSLPDNVTSLFGSMDQSNSLDFSLDTLQKAINANSESLKEAGMVNRESEAAVASEKDFLSAFNFGASNRDFGDKDRMNADHSGSVDAVDEVFTGLETDFGSESEDLFSGADMVGTKLDLARAYIDMDDRDGARGILKEVLEEGSDDQKLEAQELMLKIG